MLRRKASRTVSILVILDVALKQDGHADEIRVMVKFQSLLSWMSLLNVVRSRDYGLRYTVSILVILDVALKLVTPHHLFIGSSRLFQSLLSWMSLLNFSIGRFFLASRYAVSILVILDVALKHRRRFVRPLGGLVSILVILDVALKLVGERTYGEARSSFQSLLSWMSLLNSGQTRTISRL